MKALASWTAIAALLLSATSSLSRAEDAPLPEDPPAPQCGYKETVHMTVHPGAVTVPRTRICYGYRDYYEVKTCGAKTPILLPTCPDCDKHGAKEYPSPDCVKYGKPYKRRVLVKYIITEEVTKPKGVVECVKEVVPLGQLPSAQIPAASPVLAVPPAAEPIPAPKVSR